MIDASALPLVLAVLIGWLERQEHGVPRYLIEEAGLDRHLTKSAAPLERLIASAARPASRLTTACAVD